MAAPLSDDMKSAVADKEQGNEAFKSGDWVSAVGHYTAAMVKDPTSSTYPLNRAMAFLKLNKYLDAERDSTTALRLAPDSVKAIYRRGSARIGAGKLAEAEEDFKRILQLEPGNTAARAELDAVQKKLKNVPKPRTQPAELPVSLPTSAKSPAASSSSTAINPASTASGWEDPSQDGSASTSSKIEAARQFLKQVRMDDDLPPSTAPGEKDELPEPPQPLPARFPGESGGFLREVSTKRTGTGTGIASQRQSKVPASDTRVPTPSQPPQPSPPPHLTRTYPAPSLTRFQSSPNAPTPSRGALSTASALSFGSSSHSASTSAPRGPGQSRSIGLPTPQLSAFEFARRWREAGRLSDGSGSGGAQAQVHFLQSLNLSSLPQIMGTLLEPDLLSSLVCTLASSLRASSASHPDSGFGSGSGETPSTGRDYLIVLKEEDRPLLRVIGEMMSALPRCTRFGTAMAFLDGSERAGAALLLNALEDNGLEPGTVAALHKSWGI